MLRCNTKWSNLYHPTKRKKNRPSVDGLLSLCRVSGLDAKTCVADLDACWFCRESTNPLAMMGAALDLYLPGRNAMLATTTYVINILHTHP